MFRQYMGDGWMEARKKLNAYVICSLLMIFVYSRFYSGDLKY